MSPWDPLSVIVPAFAAILDVLDSKYQDLARKHFPKWFATPTRERKSRNRPERGRSIQASDVGGADAAADAGETGGMGDGAGDIAGGAPAPITGVADVTEVAVGDGTSDALYFAIRSSMISKHRLSSWPEPM